MHERRVNFAFGFTDGTWRKISILVPERDDYVLDEEEAILKAGEIATTVICASKGEVEFRHVLSVDDPPGGYDDRWM